MSKKVKSARGEVVDFDLLKIKEQIASAPPPTDVRARQDFIDKRLRRRLKRAQLPDSVLSKNKVSVDPVMPGTEDLDEEPEFIDETPQPRSRQKAKPPKKDN